MRVYGIGCKKKKRRKKKDNRLLFIVEWKKILQSERIEENGIRKWDLLHKIIPLDYILWDVFHSVLEEEPILVTEYRLVVTFFKGDFINRVTKGEIIFVGEGI